MKLLFYIYFISILQMSCHTDKKNEIRIIEVQENNTIKCTEKGCRGIYTGSEFINGKDIAHQFSNKRVLL